MYRKENNSEHINYERPKKPRRFPRMDNRLSTPVGRTGSRLKNPVGPGAVGGGGGGANPWGFDSQDLAPSNLNLTLPYLTLYNPMSICLRKGSDQSKSCGRAMKKEHSFTALDSLLRTRAACRWRRQCHSSFCTLDSKVGNVPEYVGEK
ncbi:hypothetical protein CC1G_13804 [Coprinopsis cinerea okayama7|uniref:Uncharacterized protein n=1 Tax=Coprinopsis cinerea (strain Okayama-7 / 130 / ATCC MYA-4618 / FGSC 9003) TaxID=240176 RepID=D6RKD3_COPC7|nr:hypothetical protein CC1G_13804 [Coprinopsis cinerea okayama7\|eukprot:XP_002912273.1 hypothetical protein CC1G_13804 [Coprinopsis cinerea okayama7\